MFMAQMDAAVVTLALPSIARAFAVTPIDLTIGVTIYQLALLVLLPTGGWIADRFGARRVFAAAVAAFTVASVLCAWSHSLGEFILARILQGGAGAFMAPVGRIILLQSSEKEDLVSVMTISTVPMLIAPSIGPALGGFITTYWSWQWIFLINVPFGVLCAWLALRLIPATMVTTQRRFDAIGYLLFATSLVLALYGLQSLGDDYPRWRRPGLCLAGGLAAGVLAVRHARSHPHAIVSLAVTGIPTFSITALSGGALIRLPIRAMPFLLPMMCQLTLGFSALKAGVLMLALNGGDLALKILTKRTLRHFGFRNVLLAMAVVSTGSLLACAAFSITTPFGVMLAVLLVSGMFRSLLFTGLGTLVFADIPRAELGSASILWNIVQQGTNVVGVSLSSILLRMSARFFGETDGLLTLGDFRFAFLIMACIGLLSLPSLWKLAPDAGASVSGHRAKTVRSRPV